MKDNTTAPERYSPARTQEARAAAVRDIVRVSSDLLQKASVRTDLNDTEAVRMVAEGMIDRCSTAGVLPTVELLAACLGHSRRSIYKWIAAHPESQTTAFFDQLRTAFSACRIAAADRGAASETLSIFLLLNSSEGYTNQHKVEITQPQNPIEVDLERVETIRARYIAALPEEYERNEEDE